MVCIYSQDGGYQIIEEPGLVLKSNVVGSINRSYVVHQYADKHTKNKFNGVKGGLTTLIGDDGNVCTKKAHVFSGITGVSHLSAVNEALIDQNLILIKRAHLN